MIFRLFYLKKLLIIYNLCQRRIFFEQLSNVAQGFCELFQSNLQKMNFIFFNQTVIKVYQQVNHDFSILTLVRNLANQVNPEQLVIIDPLVKKYIKFLKEYQTVVYIIPYW